jgi:acyl transferase domain-containing protein
VRFVEQVEAMYATGSRTFVDIGPGAVLTGLVAKILAGRPHCAINLDARGTDASTAFHRGWHGFGRIRKWTWRAVDAPPQPDLREQRCPAAAVDICGTNYGKPSARAPVRCPSERRGGPS